MEIITSEKRIHIALSIIWALTFGWIGLSFGQVSILKDINTEIVSGTPSNIVEANGKLLFMADDGLNGVELWTSDGTEGGTKMVKQISPILTLSFAKFIQFVPFNNKVYFYADDLNTGRELWMSDGTEAGTKLLKDIRNGFSSSTTSLSSRPWVLNNMLLFAADNGVNGVELWLSDGTEEGTKLLKDINPGNGSGLKQPMGIKVVNGKAYFVADDGIHGEELWVSDGTEAGTKMVKDITVGVTSSFPASFAAMGNELFFSVRVNNLLEFWKSDGTEGGTVLIKKTQMTDTKVELIAQENNKVFFRGKDVTHGSELWVSDGTDAGTKLLKDLWPGSVSGSPRKFTLYNLKLFFIANDSNGDKLWQSDGTEAGTQPITTAFDAQEYVVFNSKLYISGKDMGTNYELWQSDGTQAGTKLVKEINAGINGSYPTYLTVFNNKLYFQAQDQTHGAELWVSDGTESGTKLLKDIATKNGDAVPQNMLPLNDKMYFQVLKNNNVNESEIWVTDGTTGGTNLLKNVAVYQHFDLTAYNDKVYFYGSDGVNGYELWVSDGTESGTKMVKDINPSPSGGSSVFNTPIVMNGKLYFVANDGTHGQELWVTDGTEAGTKMVKDINPGSGNSPYGSKISIFKNKLYFSANDGVHGYELWESDGTEAGTKMVKDINPGDKSGFGSVVTVFNDKMFLVADDGVHSNEPWISDGTEAGTKLLKDINTQSINGISNSNPNQFKIFNNQLFFVAHSITNLSKIWVTDGTTAGTKEFVSINGDSRDSPYLLAEVNGKLFFSARTSNFKLGLWTTDGTAGGVKLVKTFENSPESVISLYGGLDDRVVFFVEDGVNGDELWESNGVVTRLVEDIYLGPNGSTRIGQDNLSRPVIWQNKVFMSVLDEIYGQELFVYTPQTFPPPPTITDFSPKSGQVGTEVTITGTDFNPIITNNTVKFNNTVAVVSSVTATELKVNVPQDATTGKIELEVSGQTTTTNEDFTILSAVTSLPQTLQNAQLTLFPNPVKSTLRLKLEGKAASQVNITAYNVLGKPVLQDSQSLQNGEMSIDISSLPSGQYILKIQVGKETISRKILKR